MRSAMGAASHLPGREPTDVDDAPARLTKIFYDDDENKRSCDIRRPLDKSV